MGTSVNQRSPDTDNWRLVRDIYTDKNLSDAEALRILWRAATNQNEVNLADQLTRPEIGRMSEFASRSASQSEVARDLTRYISENKISSLACDIAKRAVIQSVGRPDPVTYFTERLFAEATIYLIHRDIPGYVNPDGKFKSIMDVRRFTNEMGDRAGQIARSSAEASGGAEWSQTASTVFRAIRRRR